jgi:hypothetical protein
MSSEKDTLDHIDKVDENIRAMTRNLSARRWSHDLSKLESPEKEIFAEVSPLLSALVYGSDEYMAMLAKLKPALDHHYQSNSHHPEHWPSGINDMSLLDIMEMLADWKAAGERYKNGNLADSITFNIKRFNISEQLGTILVNTAKELGWIQ